MRFPIATAQVSLLLLVPCFLTVPCSQVRADGPEKNAQGRASADQTVDQKLAPYQKLATVYDVPIRPM